MRWTKNIRQAAERLSEGMGFKLRRTSKTHVVVVTRSKGKRLVSGTKKPIAALGYMAYLALDIYGETPSAVLERMRYSGGIPLKHGMGAHEESALRQVLAAR